MGERLTHDALLRELRAAHAGLEARVAPLSAAQMTAPGVNGDWAMRDMLAHLTAWQRRALALLEAARDGTTPDPFYTDPTDDAEIDRRNAVFFAANRVRPLDAVLADWRATERAVEATVPTISEDDLNDPSRFPWLYEAVAGMNGSDETGEHRTRYTLCPPRPTLAATVAGETYEHTGDHLPDIDAYLAGERD